jgi:hypothetical protein
MSVCTPDTVSEKDGFGLDPELPLRQNAKCTKSENVHSLRACHNVSLIVSLRPWSTALRQ